MTCNYRCLLFVAKYAGYFIQHVVRVVKTLFFKPMVWREMSAGLISGVFEHDTLCAFASVDSTD